MNKPVNPKQQKDKDAWIQISKAADEVLRKLAEKQGTK